MNSEIPISPEIFRAMSITEREAYIKDMGGSLYDQRREGNYYFGFPVYYFNRPHNVELLHSIVDDRTKVLSPEEEQVIYEGEKSSFKLHLQVADERKLEVLSRLIQIKKSQKGLENLHTWKMKDLGLEENPSADFVFYVRKAKGIPVEETLEALVREVTEAVEPLNLEGYRELHRFSNPVYIDQEEIPCLSIVQGNGDFKEYLLRTGGEKKIAQFYDPNRNYAFRNDYSTNF